MKKLIALLLAACLMLGLMTTAFAADEKSNDIVILYTNDVHCAVDDNIGYAGLAAYKKEMQAAYNYVALVDCGDSVQGDVIGTLSKGEYLVDIMNEVGYDFASFGNHEFDYTLPQLQKLIDKAKYQYLCCNLTYTAKDGKGLTGYKAYEIKTYGDTKVAFVGIDTPESFTKSTPTYFQDANGNFVYSFAEGNKGADLYNKVQETVDAAKKANGKVIGVDVDQAGVIANYAGVDGLTVTSAMKGLYPATYDALNDIINNGNWANYVGKIATLGLVSADDPEANYVQIPMGEGTQWSDSFTQDDYKAMVADMYSGKITVSNDTTKAASDFATVITVDDQGAIKG